MVAFMWNCVSKAFAIPLLIVAQALVLCCTAQKFLSVRGKNLTLNGEKVFLSGMNQAWVHYGKDFGNRNFAASKQTFFDSIDRIHDSGGNTMRVWIHVDGASSPLFNSSGYVTGLDEYIIGDLRELLQRAQSRNVVINFSLWNCVKDARMYSLYTSDSVLQSYIDNALRPMVRALREERALASWEIINEPEGCIKRGVYEKDPCFDALLDPLPWEGGGWILNLTRYQLSRFISRQADAIHEEDPKALVTVGIWTWYTITSKFPYKNFYTDECLNKAGGVKQGTLDYYQIHTYDLPIFHMYTEHDPFMTSASYYSVDRPIVIGEFSQKRGGGFRSQQLFSHAYKHGFSGVWSWCALDHDDASDNVTVQERGMAALKGCNNQSLGGQVNIVINNTFVRYVFRVDKSQGGAIFHYMSWLKFCAYAILFVIVILLFMDIFSTLQIFYKKM